MSEVVRRAIVVYDLLRSETENGKKLIVRGKDSEKELMII